MFARFYKASQDATATAYVVRDSATHNVIARGTREECQKYQGAFGLCYVEVA